MTYKRRLKPKLRLQSFLSFSSDYTETEKEMKEVLLIILCLSKTTSALEALDSNQIRLIKDLVNSDNTTFLVNFVGCFDPGISFDKTILKRRK